jgi:hypothetical protein
METWDDPAPLSRVWCLDELRNALLLGKEVQICMPTQAMRSFKTNAEKNPEASIESIKRVCSRVSIQHASATREEDRKFVLDLVKDTLSYEFLNEVCREIIRNALLEAAGLKREAVEAEEQWKARWRGIFQKMIDAADEEEEVATTPIERHAHRPDRDNVLFTTAKKKTIPQIIEIKRAVSMMQRRIFQRGSPEFAAGTDLLKEVEHLARRFYGEKSQLYSDIARQLSTSDAEPEPEPEPEPAR